MTHLVHGGLGASLLTPSFFNQFRIGLNAPEAGPLVPRFLPTGSEFAASPLQQDPDAFRLLAAAVIDQAEAVKKEGRLVERTLSPLQALFLGSVPGATREERVSGLPKALGEAGASSPGRRWKAVDVNRFAEGGIELVCSLGKEGHHMDDLFLRIQRRDERTLVTVDERHGSLQVIQTAATAPSGEGDSTSLYANLTHDRLSEMIARGAPDRSLFLGEVGGEAGLDVFFTLYAASFLSGPMAEPLFREGIRLRDLDRSTVARPVVHEVDPGWTASESIARFLGFKLSDHFAVESARAVYVEDFHSAELRPAFSVRHHKAGSRGGAGTLHLLYYHAAGGLSYPDPLVAFIRGLVHSIDAALDRPGV